MRRDAFHEDKGDRRLIPGHLAINNGGVLYQMSPRAAAVQAARCPNKVSVDAAITPHSNLRISQIVSLPVVFWTDSRCQCTVAGRFRMTRIVRTGSERAPLLRHSSGEHHHGTGTSV